MKLTEEDVQKILKIVDELDFREVRLEFGDLKLQVLKKPVGEPDTADAGPAFAATPAPARDAAPAKAAVPAARKSKPAAAPAGSVIKAPLAGVVYHSPKPGSPPYVTLGQSIQADQTVCLVEVMKLFQSVPAGAAGRITAVLVEDGAQIREGQPLFSIEPA
jgi:acetyl-CoA carboxylase biotin carboxyl carrier protein